LSTLEKDHEIQLALGNVAYMGALVESMIRRSSNHGRKTDRL